jgi:uncharacterized membrane protein
MTERPRNLAPQRGPSVWDRPETPAGWSLEESERWCVGICGATLALLGLRQRSTGGILLAAAGGIVALRAALGHRDLFAVRCAVQRLAGPAASDQIDQASDDSFPASDAPSWTPTAGAKAP